MRLRASFSDTTTRRGRSILISLMAFSFFMMLSTIVVGLGNMQTLPTPSLDQVASSCHYVFARRRVKLTSQISVVPASRFFDPQSLDVRICRCFQMFNQKAR